MRTWWGPFVAVILIHIGSTTVYFGALMLFGGLTSYEELTQHQPSFWTGMFSYALFAIASVVFTVVAAGSQAARRLWLAVPAVSKGEVFAACIAAWAITNLGGYLVQWMQWFAREPGSNTDPFGDWNTASTPGQRLLGIFIIALSAGVSEELLCRGLLMRSWMQRWHPGVAISVSGLIFAMLHRSPAHVLSVLPAGLWLGYVAWKTRSTLSSMWAHVITLVGMMVTSQWYSDSNPWLAWAGWLASTAGGCIAAIWLVRKWNNTATPPNQSTDSASPVSPNAQSVTPANTDATLAPRA